MKANKFIKEFGLEQAKINIEYMENRCRGKSYVRGLMLEDLKRLVESYELIESYGGLENSKIEVKKRPSQLLLKKAITDVESCL